jgi:hypothetical protein
MGRIAGRACCCLAHTPETVVKFLFEHGVQKSSENKRETERGSWPFWPREDREQSELGAEN